MAGVKLAKTMREVRLRRGNGESNSTPWPCYIHAYNSEVESSRELQPFGLPEPDNGCKPNGDRLCAKASTVGPSLNAHAHKTQKK